MSFQAIKVGLLFTLFFAFSECQNEYISKNEMIEILNNFDRKWQMRLEKFQESVQDMLKTRTDEVKASCKNEIHEMSNQFQNLLDRNADSKNYSTMAKRQPLDTNNKDAYSEVQNQLQSLTNDVKQIKNKRSGSSRIRGFTALLSHQGQNLGSDQIIKFQSIISNVGNCYSPYTGVFASDTEGLYAFYLHSLSTPGKHVELRIKKNNQEIVVTYSYDKEYYSSSGNMGVIELAIGDTVFVETHGGQVDHSGDVLETGHTSFSGFLISESV